MTHQTTRTVAVEPAAGPGVPLYTLVLAGALRLHERDEAGSSGGEDHSSS